MADVDLIKSGWPEIKDSAPHRKWVHDNPGEAGKLDVYVAAISAGGSPAPPTLTTKYGRGMVKWASMALPEVLPGPTPTPEPTPGPTMPRFGISVGGAYEGVSAADRYKDLDLCKEVNAEMVRFDHGGASYQDQIAADVAARGMTPLIILFGTSNSPRIDPGPLAGQVATRWKSLPWRIYEILNEPDIHGWTPDVYAQFALRAITQIKDADDRAIAWCGGFFNGNNQPATLPQEFAKALLKYKVPFDAFSSHLHDGDDTWVDKKNGWHMLYPHGDWPTGYTVREILDAGGKGATPMVSSESHSFFGQIGGQAQADQVRRYVRYMTTPPNSKCEAMGAMVYYRMRFGEAGRLDSSLLNADWTKRLAFSALQEETN